MEVIKHSHLISPVILQLSSIKEMHATSIWESHITQIAYLPAQLPLMIFQPSLVYSNEAFRVVIISTEVAGDPHPKSPPPGYFVVYTFDGS